ncbi:CGNR zinc finger domain-containing protein [Thermobispora bispora]|uniref:Zinc finger CGNR domain-containing protein n=1 Tax=Thermobispora bispora (strain ATCC 19993 / DSM 43833 / CBS 139.67 / JCM 10125 / KCTC 9307 / NBRC 14880 / R51) TaxID=469371 RepID=D6Y7X6_THEBD|nr:CGNR zinc finger domain-containing protein [Thermobispora bispora]ADG87795.1 protein of unknown function DUF1470 [Thermobispora bispora DSM 43833]MBX6167465.1 CGNR zinc finger domain-containing protein [Thermobispora bispora]
MGPAELLRDFVNTYDVESDADRLTSPAELTAWLRERGLIGDGDRAADDDLALAIRLREGLRAVLRRGHGGAGRDTARDTADEPAGAAAGDTAQEPGGDPAGDATDAPTEGTAGNAQNAAEDAGDAVRDAADLDAVLAALPVRVSLATGAPTLEPIRSGAAAGLARIAGMIPAAYAEGTWSRLKVCAESTCQWAFIDSSKNRSRAWCSMRVCGNRTKTRAYRARRRAQGTPRPS